MDITRLKFLSGIKKKPEVKPDSTVTGKFTSVKMVNESAFRILAKHFGAADLKLQESGAHTVATLTFKEQTSELSLAKLNEFNEAWQNYLSTGKIEESKSKEVDVTTVNEDHGKGFYVMVDGEEHCWCETKDEADEKAEKLEKEGKKASVVADKDIKEGKEDEEGSDNKKVAAEKSEEGSEEEAEAEGEKEVKEAIVDNFVQDDTDKDNTVAKRTGTDAMMNKTIKIPEKVKTAVNARIAELKKSIEFYDEKGYNDQSQKQKAIECLQQIMDDLAPANVEALKKAQIYFGTLMSPITDLIPSQLVLFLANAEAVKEQEDKDRASVLKRHVAYHESSMRLCDKDSTSYKDHQKALERYKKELAQYE